MNSIKLDLLIHHGMEDITYTITVVYDILPTASVMIPMNLEHMITSESTVIKRHYIIWLNDLRLENSF